MRARETERESEREINPPGKNKDISENVTFKLEANPTGKNREDIPEKVTLMWK